MAAPPRRARLEQWLQRHWRGPRPDAVAQALRPLAWLHAGLRRLADTGPSRLNSPPDGLPVPVLVVGNLLVGGAGKTPTVLALLPLLRQLGFHPGVVSRGHGRRGDGVRLIDQHSPAAEVGDEPLLIHRRGAVPVAVGRDRRAAARALLAAVPSVDLLLADDGLQHRRLPRNLEVWLFDDRGLGNGLLLPAGPLRQPLAEALASPVPRLVLYSAGPPGNPLPGHTGRRTLGPVLPLADWWAAAPPEQPSAPHHGHRPADPWAALRGRRLLAVAGLARPQAFFDALRAQGLAIDTLPLPDHAPLDPLPWPDGTTDVVLTEKDAVKLAPDAVGQTRVWVVTLDFQPAPGFVQALAAATAQWPRRGPPR